MRRHKIRNRELALLLNRDPYLVTQLRNGKIGPTFSVMVSLFRVFPEKNAHWLVTGDGEPK